MILHHNHEYQDMSCIDVPKLYFPGILIGVGCLLYPLGWETHEARQICGPSADIYALGKFRSHQGTTYRWH